MKGKTILVTGGAGFIGSNIANSLVDDNEVIVVDNEYLGDSENLRPEVEFWNTSVLNDDLPTYGVDVVFHLAALSSYQMHEDDASEGAKVNVEGFVNTVEQAYESGCDTVVYASTSSIYGSQTTPTAEDYRPEVNTGYEASKMAREEYAEYFSNHYDMNMCGLRLFSVYQGASEDHKGEFANVITQFAQKILDGKSPVLYGDGKQTRDFTHVDDIVDGFVLSAEKQLNGIYNVGTGERYSFLQVVDMLNEEFDKDIKPEFIENPIPEDVYVHDTCADNAKLRDEGWEPDVTFEEGIQRVCEDLLEPIKQ